MQGRDKPLELWGNDSLVRHILRSLPHGQVLISANRSLSSYRALGWPVIEDNHYEGPLAGVAAAASQIQESANHWLYVVAGDTPRLPGGLANALRECCVETDSVAACVSAERVHPLPFLVRADALQTLSAYLANGSRSVLGWLTELHYARLSRPDQEALFVNVNTPEQLRLLNASIEPGTNSIDAGGH